jgi:hypothetical protein
LIVAGNSTTTESGTEWTTKIGIPAHWSNASHIMDIKDVGETGTVLSKHGQMTYYVASPDPGNVLSPNGTAAATNNIAIMVGALNSTCLSNTGELYVIDDSNTDKHNNKIWSNTINDKVSTAELGSLPAFTKFDNNTNTQYLVSRNGKYMAIKTSANVIVIVNTYNAPEFGKWATGSDVPPVRKSSSVSSMISFCHATRSNGADPLSFADPRCLCLPDEEIVQASFDQSTLTTNELTSLVTHVSCITKMCSETL